MDPFSRTCQSGAMNNTYLQQLCTDTGCCPENLQGRWIIETKGDRESGKPVLAAWLDDDYDIYI